MGSEEEEEEEEEEDQEEEDWLKKHANGKPPAVAPSIKVEKKRCDNLCGHNTRSAS